MLNNEIQFLVDQASRLPHIEWADLEARITKAVEDRPSLYREEECEAGYDFRKSISHHEGKEN